ncbi:hypothetical protein ScPMuIL_010397 [Solemya velum]
MLRLYTIVVVVIEVTRTFKALSRDTHITATEEKPEGLDGRVVVLTTFGSCVRMVSQVGLLAAGCQPWHMDVCAASGDRFAYSATLAIYIYELDREFHEFRLVSIMSEHKKTITAIAWSPDNPDVFASASVENKIILWNVLLQKPVSILDNTKALPMFIGWCCYETKSVTYISGKGPLYMWKCETDGSLIQIKGAAGFVSDVSRLRWHPKKLQKVVLGHLDGSISICSIGSKSFKHVLQPEVDEEEHADNPVTALEWDPLFYGLFTCVKHSPGRSPCGYRFLICGDEIYFAKCCCSGTDILVAHQCSRDVHHWRCTEWSFEAVECVEIYSSREYQNEADRLPHVASHL